MKTLRWRQPGVVSDTVDGVTIAIDLDSGTYYQFSRDASCILDTLPVSQATVAQMAPAGLSVDSFIAELLELGLLEQTTDEASGANARDFEGDGLSYQSFTDLAHILMLDPIHDVDPPMGWPHADGPQA